MSMENAIVARLCLKRACVMACYQPTRNCYYCSVGLNFAAKNCDSLQSNDKAKFTVANGDFT